MNETTTKDDNGFGMLGEGHPETMDAPNWRKVLLNFCSVDTTTNGKTHPSVEHCFHAAKALWSDRPQHAKDFEIEGQPGKKSPLGAKMANSRSGFAREDATLARRQQQAQWCCTLITFSVTICKQKIDPSMSPSKVARRFLGILWQRQQHQNRRCCESKLVVPRCFLCTASPLPMDLQHGVPVWQGFERC